MKTETQKIVLKAADGEATARIVELIVHNQAHLLGMDDQKSDDEKLMEASYCAGQIATAIRLGNMFISGGRPFSAQYYLQRLAAFCLGWAEGMNPGMDSMVAAVFAERRRQRSLLTTGRIKFACWEPGTNVRWIFRVLVEELGEVAEGIDRVDENKKSSNVHDDLQAEIIQVAAVAVAWLEGMEGK